MRSIDAQALLSFAHLDPLSIQHLDKQEANNIQ